MGRGGCEKEKERRVKKMEQIFACGGRKNK
jgi:hypothetical protein